MTENGISAEVDEETLLQDPDYKSLIDYGINKIVAAELKKIYETGLNICLRSSSFVSWIWNLNCFVDHTDALLITHHLTG